MKKEIFRLSDLKRLNDFQRNDVYFVSNKTIHKKDFSECSIRQVNFSNCIFNWTGFPCTKCEDLTFENCILQNTHFTDSELGNFIFNNCQLTNISFAGSDLMDFAFINCQLTNVGFSVGELSELQFENSQLQEICFSGNLLDNITIKNSTLENIRFESVTVYKEDYNNGVLIANRIPINNLNVSRYTEFFKLEEKSEISVLDNELLTYQATNELQQDIEKTYMQFQEAIPIENFNTQAYEHLINQSFNGLIISIGLTILFILFISAHKTWN